MLPPPKTRDDEKIGIKKRIYITLNIKLSGQGHSSALDQIPCQTKALYFILGIAKLKNK